MVEVRCTQPGDAALLFANLRPADMAECLAYGGDVREGIEASVRRSLLCWTAWVDGELAAIFGVAPLVMLTGMGAPWMLGTPLIGTHRRVLVGKTPEYIAQMQRSFPHLVNFVHARNKASVRWLRRLGFTIHGAVPYGPFAEMFHPFEMRA